MTRQDYAILHQTVRNRHLSQNSDHLIDELELEAELERQITRSNRLRQSILESTYAGKI